MIIAVALSLTVIPAFFALVKSPAPVSRAPYLLLLSNLLHSYRRVIVVVTLTVAALVTYIAKDAYFDYSTLSLKNPNSEALQLFLQVSGGLFSS